MGAIIAFANQKGGVGKTTTTISLAAVLGKLGKKVLLVDMDPQGNATTGVSVQKKQIKGTMYEVIIGALAVQDVIVETKFKNLDLIPATTDLAGAEVEMVQMEKRDTRTKEILSSVQDKYDYILIDCPPTLGMLTINALVACHGVIIPMQCEFFALEGMSQLVVTIRKIKKSYNPNLDITGIVLTMYSGRLVLTNHVVKELKKYYADKLFKTPISRSVKLSEAPGFGEPICYLEPYGKSALEYTSVAKELITRI